MQVAAGFLFAPSSISTGAVSGMLPFAAVLAVIALGQTLVVMQGGIDLSYGYLDPRTRRVHA